MDSDLKHDIGIFALMLTLGFGWYLADLIPVLVLTGRDIVFLGIILEAGIYIIKRLIAKYTGATEEDLPLEVNTIQDVTFEGGYVTDLLGEEVSSSDSSESTGL